MCRHYMSRHLMMMVVYSLHWKVLTLHGRFLTQTSSSRPLLDNRILRQPTSESRSRWKVNRVMSSLCAVERPERQRLKFKYKSHSMTRKYLKMMLSLVLLNLLTSNLLDLFTFFLINASDLVWITWRKSRLLIFWIRSQSPSPMISTNGLQKMKK